MLQKYEVKITKQAQAQMKEIIHYISHELLAPQAAKNLLSKLEASMNSLSKLPEKNACVEEEPWHSQGIRKIIVNNFLVYFWIDKENLTVQVIAVVYSRRDQMNQLMRISLED